MAAVTTTNLPSLPKIAEGKVRDLYEIDKSTLLFVATDRISAYDVIMDNVSYSLTARGNKELGNKGLRIKELGNKDCTVCRTTLSRNAKQMQDVSEFTTNP